MTNRDTTSWLPGLATALAILSCYGTMLLVGVLSLLGMTARVDDRAWAAAIGALATLAVVALAWSSRRHRSMRPATIALAGLALILWSLYGSYAITVEGAGFALLVVATFWDRRIGRRTGVATVSWIEPRELADRLQDPTGPAVVDVRSQQEFIGPLGHIPAARNLPTDELGGRLHELDTLKHRLVVLVCRTDKRSSAASSVLRDAGFRDVAVLRGGMERWNREHRPVTAGAAGAEA